MKNEFLKQTEEVMIYLPRELTEIQKNKKHMFFFDSTLGNPNFIHETIFSSCYYHVNFFEQPLAIRQGMVCFHRKCGSTEGEVHTKIQNHPNSFPEDFHRFFDPRLKRDILLAWSIRKDFYKYYIKINITNPKIFMESVEFLNSTLPLEENFFFLFEDGFYICNPINDENLNKIKLHFKEENVFINDHELYFDLDQDKYYPNILLNVGYRKNIIKFTYFVSVIDFDDFFENHKCETRFTQSIFDFIKDKNFFLAYDKPDIKWDFGIKTEAGLIPYYNYIDSEWRRIPSWYKEFVTEDMLNIKKDEDVIEYEKGTWWDKMQRGLTS